MRRMVALVLIGALIAPPALAGPTQGKPISWQKAQTLKAGTEIVVTVAGGQPKTERVLFVDEASLVTRKAAPPKLAGRVEKALLDVAANWPAVFDVGVTARSGRVRVSRDGVFDGDKKLADLTEVVRRTHRGDVLTIAEPPDRHMGRKIGLLVIGAVVVAVIAFIRAYGSG